MSCWTLRRLRRAAKMSRSFQLCSSTYDSRALAAIGTRQAGRVRWTLLAQRTCRAVLRWRFELVSIERAAAFPTARLYETSTATDDAVGDRRRQPAAGLCAGLRRAAQLAGRSRPTATGH